MFENIIQQIDLALQRLSSMSKLPHLVIVMGLKSSGKSTLIKYCCEHRYAHEEIDEIYTLVSLDGHPTEHTGIGIFIHENMIFFEWRLFQRLSDIEKMAEQFLLSHLLKSVDSVSWISAIDYYSALVGRGQEFNQFYDALNTHKLISKTVRQSIRWIATRRPEEGTFFSVKRLLTTCQIIIPGCFSQMTDLLVTDEGQSQEILLKELRDSKTHRSSEEFHQMSIPVSINEHAVAALQCALSHTAYSRVADFFLDVIELSDWLEYGLTNPSPLNDLLVKQLVKRLMVARISDPYDDNDQHRVIERPQSLMALIDSLPVTQGDTQLAKLKEAGLLLDRYHKGESDFKETELLTLCQDLSQSDGLASSDVTSTDVEVLSQGVQAALTTRYNQHILEVEDPKTEQEYIASQLDSAVASSETASFSDSHLSVFNKMLSMFNMFSLLKSSEVKLIQETVSQFHHFAHQRFEGGNAKELLKYLCAMLASLDSGKTIAQDYLKPLLYLIDDEENIVPECTALPISQEKLAALKQLHQTVTNLFERLQNPHPGITADIFMKAAGKILYALLILTEQEPLLTNWLSDLLLETGDVSEEKIICYFTEKVAPFKEWMTLLKGLEPWLNSDTFQLHTLSDKTNLNDAKEKLFQAIKTIIVQIDASYPLDTGTAFNESIAREAVMFDIEHGIDFLKMNVESGFGRYEPLLQIVSKYYERKNLEAPLSFVSSLTPLVRLIHQLFSARHISELRDILNDFKASEIALLTSEPLALAQLLSVIDLCSILSSAIQEIKDVPDKVTFSMNLLTKIENKLPIDMAGSDTLRTWCIAAKVVLNGYSAIPINKDERLSYLKTQEDEIKRLSKFSEEAQMVLRLLVSMQYLSDNQRFQPGRWQKNLSELLNSFVAPLAMIWAQHETTATAIFVPYLLQALSDISALPRQNLSIENCFKPILEAISHTHETLEQREKEALLVRELSNVYQTVHTLNGYLKTGRRLYEGYQTGKVILTKLKSLDFCQKRLEEMGASTKQVVKGMKLMRSAIQSGELETAVQQTQSLLSQMSSIAGGTTNVVANVAGSAVSCTTVLGAVNLVASVANIAVTVYYGRKIMAKVEEIGTKLDSLGAQQEKLIRYAEASQVELQKISTQIDREINKLDQSIAIFKSEMTLSFHQIKLHQEYLLDEMKKGFERLHLVLEELNDRAELRELKGKIIPMVKRAERLSDILIEVFSEATQEKIIDIYLDLLSLDTGLGNHEFNGMTTNPRHSRKLFFLQILFPESQDHLPNLIIWMKSCFAINQLFSRITDRQIELTQELLEHFQKKHIEVIRRTFRILSALNTATTKSYILGLLHELKNNQAETDTALYEHVHLIARLCGLPLHQFGEHGFELWKMPEEGLPEEQQRQKQLLETSIIQSLETILLSPDGLKSSSRFILSVEHLLRELTHVGMGIFPSLMEHPHIQKICTELRLQPQILVTNMAIAAESLEDDALVSESSLLQSYNTRGIGFLGTAHQVRENRRDEPLMTREKALSMNMDI